MKLIIVSHKPCWRSSMSPSGYVTDGGFPFQVEALSELFDQTVVVVPVRTSLPPAGTHPLAGHHLTVRALDHPSGQRWRRKLSFLRWLPANLPPIWRAIQRADAVHTPIPGDLGTVGLLASLAQRKPLCVRYCGIWGQSQTTAQHFWHWLLIKIAGGRNVVFATGGSDRPPSAKNPAIQWMFATSMRRAEMEALPQRRPWRSGEPLRLITVGRQESGKNTNRLIHALTLVRECYPQTTLHIVGDGSCLPALRRLATELDMTSAVTFHGKLNHDQVIAALSRADLFCFPTDSEGFPKAVHEALACGLPVITTPVSVLTQLVGDRNGILLSDIRPETIARAVLHTISDDCRFTQMVQTARQTARSYSLEAWRDQIGETLSQAWGSLGGKDQLHQQEIGSLDKRVVTRS